MEEIMAKYENYNSDDNCVGPFERIGGPWGRWLDNLCRFNSPKPKNKCPECGVELQKDPEDKYDFWCPKCKNRFHHGDLPKKQNQQDKQHTNKSERKNRQPTETVASHNKQHNRLQINKKQNKQDKQHTTKSERKNRQTTETVASPSPKPSPCLFVFAVLIPNSELNKWYTESEKPLQFTEELQEILLQNNVWIGVTEIGLLDELKNNFRDNAKENGDIYMFIVESQTDKFRKKIENKDFYPTDLQDLFKKFVQEKTFITEFTPVDSEIEILSKNSPFDIQFIQP